MLRIKFSGGRQQFSSPKSPTSCSGKPLPASILTTKHKANTLSIEDTNTIDLLGFDKTSGDCILTISDHMKWEVESNHIIYLQEKLNTYIEFIESGQLFEEFPNAKGRKLSIQLAMKHDPKDYSLLNQIKAELKKLGYEFSFEHLKTEE